MDRVHMLSLLSINCAIHKERLRVCAYQTRVVQVGMVTILWVTMG